MTKKARYSSQNKFSLMLVFSIFFMLLYLIATYLHEMDKKSQQQDLISIHNMKLKEEKKQQKLQELHVADPQRIQKEAKIQMNRKVAGETVITLIEKKSELLPIEQKIEYEREQKQNLPNWRKWEILFFE